MKKELPSRLLVRLFFQPKLIFSELAELEPSPSSVFFRAALWLGMLPPIFAYIGASTFGWRLGTVEPLFLQKKNITEYKCCLLLCVVNWIFKFCNGVTVDVKNVWGKRLVWYSFRNDHYCWSTFSYRKHNSFIS